MRRAFTILTALTAVTVLGACSTDDADTTATDSTVSEGDTGGDDAMETEGAMGDDAMETEGAMSDPTCEEFFAGQGTPVAERAETQRETAGAGEDIDPVAFSEMTLLSSRISTLVDTADGEQAALLERINAPFQEINDAVIEDGTRMDEEIAIPSVDVEDSAAAQDELMAACEG